MNNSRTWLALAAAACLALPAAAAPVPAVGPESQGPISDALRLRDKLPQTAPPQATPAVMADESTIELERRNMVTVAKQVEEIVEMDGKKVTVARIVTEMVPQVYKVRVAVKDCKFFLVTNEGKLEALDAKKAAGMLKKQTPVLTGDKAEVDPKSLAVVKPGTIYLVAPLNQVLEAPPPPLPDRPIPDRKP
jgi:hypothetical protein